MALEFYGATADKVLTYLPKYQVKGHNLPLYATVDTDGDFINRAAAEVGSALQRGGHGLAAGNDPSATPNAYYIIQGIVCERAALYFANATKHMEVLEDDDLQGAWSRSEQQLENLASGMDVGELELSAGEGRLQGKFYHGSDSRAVVDARRYKFGDEM